MPYCINSNPRLGLHALVLLASLMLATSCNEQDPQGVPDADTSAQDGIQDDAADGDDTTRDTDAYSGSQDADGDDGKFKSVVDNPFDSGDEGSHPSQPSDDSRAEKNSSNNVAV